MSYLTFISDQNLIACVQKIIDSSKKAYNKKIDKNVLDPFSAIFDATIHHISYEEWLNMERQRQIQKSIQNAIGNFHQDVLGASFGCENLKNGQTADFLCRSKKILAEIKNKFNTTKGNHRIAVYDDLFQMLQNDAFVDFEAYYVEIIPSSSNKTYNKPFTPPDNRTKTCRVLNPKIRVIDGQSFYSLVTGVPDALQQLFEVIPKILNHLDPQFECHDVDIKRYLNLFGKAFNL